MLRLFHLPHITPHYKKGKTHPISPRKGKIGKKISSQIVRKKLNVLIQFCLKKEQATSKIKTQEENFLYEVT
jgi:hypothetical protein